MKLITVHAAACAIGVPDRKALRSLVPRHFDRSGGWVLGHVWHLSGLNVSQVLYSKIKPVVFGNRSLCGDYGNHRGYLLGIGREFVSLRMATSKFLGGRCGGYLSLSISAVLSRPSVRFRNPCAA